MAEISVGDAIGSGFQLIFQKPLAVFSWGLVRMGFTVAVFALLAPFYISYFSLIAQNAASGSTAPPDTAAIMPQMMAMEGTNFLIQIASVLVSSVLYCAVARAVLHPEKSAFAYLRIGAPELYLIVLLIGFVFALAIGLLILMIPLFIAVGILAAAHAAAAAVGVGILGGLAIVVVVIYFMLRFSFVAPMMVDDGQFHLFESWTLTRGRVGSLFLIGLGLFVILIVAEIIIGILFFGIGAATLGAVAGGFQNLQAFFQQPPATIIGKLLPILFLFVLLAIPISGAAVAITGAPWARAYRDLAPQPGAVATFS